MTQLSTGSGMAAQDIAKELICSIYGDLIQQFSVEFADLVLDEIVNLIVGDQR